MASNNNRRTYELMMKIAGKVDPSLASAVENVSSKMDALGNVGSKVTSTLLKIGSAVAGALAIKSIGSAFDEVAEKGDNAAKTAARLGTGIEAIQELDYAFKTKGIDDFSSKLEKMQQVMVKAAQSGTEESGIFKEFGLDAQKIAAMDPAQAIERMSDFMNTLPSDTERARLAMGLFGESGVEMVQAMKMGSTGIQALREEARKTGSVMSTEMAKNAEAYGDAKEKLNKTIEGIKVQIFGPLIPYVAEVFEKIAGKLQEFIPKIQEFISRIPELIETWKPKVLELADSVIKTIMTVKDGVLAVVDFVGGWQNIIKIIGSVVSVFTALRTGFKIFNGVIKIIPVLQKIWGAVTKVVKVVKILFTLIAANPVALIIAAVVALVAVFVLLWNKCEGFRNFFIGMWEKIKPVLGAVWEWIKTKAVAVWEFLQSFWSDHGESVMTSLTDTWESIKGAVSAVWDWMKDKALSVFNALKSFWDDHGDSVMGALLNVWEIIKSALSIVWENIKSVAETVFSVLQNFWDTWGDTIMSILGTAWEWIQNTFHNVCDAIQGIFDVFAALFRGDWEGVWDGIKEYFGAIWQQIQDTFSAVFDTVWAIFEDFPSKISKWFSGLWDTFKKGIGKLADLFEPLSNILNNIGGFFSNIGDAASGFFSKIGSLFGGGSKESSIPGYASGGYVTSPKLATVAEKVPEYIIPMDNSERSFKLWQSAGANFADKAPQIDESVSSDGGSSALSTIPTPRPKTSQNGSTIHLEYKPVNNFYGTSEDMKRNVEKVQQKSYEDLAEKLRELQEDERRVSYA